MKIVWTDNFNRDTIADRLVAEGITNDSEAEIMLTALRTKCTATGPDWYKLMHDDDTLNHGMEDLV